MSGPEETTFSGLFDIAADRQLYGTLTLDGPRTKLEVQDREFFNTNGLNGDAINGELRDFEKVTLVGCLTSPAPGTFWRKDRGRSHFAEIFPHFVSFGDEHLDPEAEDIVSASFVVDDAKVVFYDFDAFGTLLDGKEMVSKIVELNSAEFGRTIRVGDHPRLMYFTGQYEIFSCDTHIGLMSANHAPSFGMGGPEGIGANNKIRMDALFHQPVSFHECIERVIFLVKTLGLMAGRPQNISDLVLGMRRPSGGDNAYLRLFWSMPPKRGADSERGQTHPADVPVNGGMAPDEFSALFKAWIDRHPLLSEARNRLFTCLSKQNSYDVDRLVGAANMFDLLPDALLPEKVRLSPDMAEAIRKSVALFKALPSSLERDSVLGYLGRIDESSLKKKVRHRAEIVQKATGNRFPELITATDAAVEARNHFVHGRKLKFSVEEVLVFLTDTLEFVFMVSDLIECGWNFEKWAADASVSHPLGAYRISYGERMDRLMKMLKSGKT